MYDKTTRLVLVTLVLAGRYVREVENLILYGVLHIHGTLHILYHRRPYIL
jgi:hypothetical protein